MPPGIPIPYAIVYKLIILPLHITIQRCIYIKHRSLAHNDKVMDVDMIDKHCVFKVLTVDPCEGLKNSSCRQLSFVQTPRVLIVP